MSNPDPLFFPALLYAETHFRFFRFFPSLLFKKFPEVIFDVPRRVAPGYDLPVVLLVNDIDRFPVECVCVDISVSQTKPARLFRFEGLEKHILDHPFAFQSAAYLFTIPRTELAGGNIFINCAVSIKRKGKTFTILNDNLPGSSKFSFSCFIADEHLPGFEQSSFGDVHVHSHYSQSHVEFGPPLAIIDLFAKCYGNDFVAITDHSYDLACSMDNYLKPDPELSRWESIVNETSKKLFQTILILGEEISCFNSKRKAVHLCGIGLHNYIPGTLDGARQGIKSDEQLPLETAIAQIHDQQGVAIAAHPGSSIGFMQRIFLNRGVWRQKDFSSGIDGIQGINNGFGKSWRKAKSLWINELLKGHKLSLLAGNDCHGDFNRYRYLSVPFIMVNESFSRYFSNAMTGIYAKASSQHDVISCIKKGKTFVGSGPFLTISFSDSPMESIISNDDISLSGRSVTISLISSCEIGLPYCIRLYYGEKNQEKEKKVFFKYFNDTNYSVNETIPTLALVNPGYIRAEAECKKEDGIFNFAVTSPCYFR